MAWKITSLIHHRHEFVFGSSPIGKRNLIATSRNCRVGPIASLPGVGSGVGVPRGFLLSFGAVGVAFAVLFAAYPSFDMQVAEWFFDPNSAKFPLATEYEWKMVRQAANWFCFLLLAPAVFALLRKLVLPGERMLVAPSIVLYLLGSFLLGPRLTSNLLLKENWGLPRPNVVQQFCRTADF